MNKQRFQKLAGLLKEEISRDEVVRDLESVQTIVDGKRGVAFVAEIGTASGAIIGWWQPEWVKTVKKLEKEEEKRKNNNYTIIVSVFILIVCIIITIVMFKS